MHRGHALFAALAVTFGLSLEARAETNCDLPQVAQDKVVTVRGKIKSIDIDRGDKSYWVVVELKDRCGTADINVSTKQSPRCRVGANVSVTGALKGTSERLIEAPRIVCVK
jgi:hypothetical protein